MIYIESDKDIHRVCGACTEPVEVYIWPVEARTEPAEVYTEPAEVCTELVEVYTEPAEV